MGHIIVPIFIFLFGYILNMFYITVLYHRALAHDSVKLSPALTRFLNATGIWVTGMEPLAWVAMHRLHHQHSDTEHDPHSPQHLGVLGVWMGQYVAYKKIIAHLINKDDPKINLVVRDLPLNVSLINRKGFSNLPYIIHGLIGILLAVFSPSWINGAAYFFGIMSHPVQGWMVNALAHKYGKRNYETPDASTNNLFVAWLVFGEGLQNNHHAQPKEANFSRAFLELDLGYSMCRIAEFFGLLKINNKGV